MIEAAAPVGTHLMMKGNPVSTPDPIRIRAAQSHSGKNLIYHLLNKNFRKYIKLLLNKKRVNETVNLLLPSQTPKQYSEKVKV